MAADDTNTEIEMDDDEEKESSSDSSDGEEEKELELEEKISALETQISQNPYVYDNHVERIKYLKQLGDLHRLRDARNEMHKYFPLTEELWLEWLRDEIPLVSSDEERKLIEDLFEKAFNDYVSVPIWLEYVQFAIGRMKEEKGLSIVRDAFERAINSVGLHVSQGSNIWDAYREFENAILSGLLPQPGAVVTAEDEEAFKLQNQKVLQLFRRQLSIPLLYMDNTLEEYKEWLGQDDINLDIQRSFDAAKEKLDQLKVLEDKLLRADVPQLETYQEYIQHELKSEDPVRIQGIFERALKDNCLNPDLWLQYTGYLDKLKFKQQIESAYERAVRNCPWCSQLWVKYLLALERQRTQFETMKALVERALLAGFSHSSDYLSVWCQYCDYLKRRIQWDSDHEETLETFRLTMQRAIDYIYENFGAEGDQSAVLQQYLAFVEAKFCKNMERAREIWNEIMQAGHGSEAQMWLHYFRLERMCGDVKHCRRLLQKALNSVTDWPESITQVYIQLEREEGDLEQYDVAVSRCDAQMERIRERREKMEQNQQEVNKKVKPAAADNKSVKKKRKQNDLNTEAEDGSKVQFTKKKGHIEETGEPAVKRKKMENVSDAGESIKTDIDSSTAVVPHGEVVKHDPSKDSITIFVSNLDFSIEESVLKDFFQKCGEITNIRLVRNYKGKSKGFGYVEFTDSNAVLKALKMDREFINGRPVFVSRCEDRSACKPSQTFKFSTNMEKNKLFIKGLPFSLTKDELEEIFKVHGKLKDIRLVTYRNGHSKGLAYVEYNDEQTASQAVLKTDGMVIGENTISVAISNPPERKASSVLTITDFGPGKNLGGGKKESQFRGKARTQVTLLPRSVQQMATKPDQTSQPAETSDRLESDNTTMNNADFRAMLLKK